MHGQYLPFCLKEKDMKPRVDGDIKTYLEEIGCEGVNWIHLAQDTDQ
jgi:hypothetical protein